MNNIDKFKKIIEEITESYYKKENVSDESFDTIMDKFDIKFNNLIDLMVSKETVSNKAIQNALLDIANYCIISKISLNKANRKQAKVVYTKDKGKTFKAIKLSEWHDNIGTPVGII